MWAMAGLFVASFVSVGSGAAKGAMMASASLAGGGTTLQAPTRTEPYRFFHIDGGFYKVKNTSCPVPWVRRLRSSLQCCALVAAARQ